MDRDDSHNEWELSKENVQPLKQGRKFANLSMALQSTSEENLSRLRTERQYVTYNTIYRLFKDEFLVDVVNYPF